MLLNFKPLDRVHAEGLLELCLMNNYGTCDTTPLTLWLWAPFYKTEYAEALSLSKRRMVFIRHTKPCSRLAYMFPMCHEDDTAEALDILEQNVGERIIFTNVTSLQNDVLLKRYGERADSLNKRDWADYIYDSEDLSFFKGKRFSGQRNHMNSFIKSEPEWRFVKITQDNAHLATDFLRTLEKDLPAPSDAFELFERTSTKDLFSDYSFSGMLGGYIETKNGIVALAVGEVIGDMLYVHIEKAMRNVRGAYQMIVSQFSQAFAINGVQYINREEDVGDEGLRTSKLSYHPIKLNEKYTVAIKA